MTAFAMTSTPAHAQLAVFDPHNYSQNLLTAARTLQQINNQIQSLQNEANMLVNQAKNLTRISFPEMQALTQTMQQVDRLMGQAARRENVDVGIVSEKTDPLVADGIGDEDARTGDRCNGLNRSLH